MSTIHLFVFLAVGVYLIWLVLRKLGLMPSWENRSAPWPKGVPELYPELSENQFCNFLSKDEYERIRAMRQVIVTPFYDEHSTPEERSFGIGLQKLLIRDLRLHREISVLGPEDSPQNSLFDVKLNSQAYRNRTLIGGVIRFEDDRYRGYFRAVEGDTVLPLEVEDGDFHPFLLQCAQGLLSLLELKADETLLSYWKVGRPALPQELISLGELAEMPGDTNAAVNRALELVRKNPAFLLPLHVCRDTSKVDVEMMLQGFVQDPYDVQLQFLIHNRLWTGSKGEYFALQYVRWALELCPGHGKAHMVVFCSAPAKADIYFHSALGYKLLPGNTFAVTNYVNYLVQHKMVPDDLSIAYELVSLDPDHIDPYWLGIDLLKQAGHWDEALAMALQLKQVATPPLSERTIYCIQQNPRQAAKWEAGTYQPLAQVEKEIAELKTSLAQAASRNRKAS